MHTLYIATHNDSGDNFNCSPRKIRSHLFDFSQRKDSCCYFYKSRKSSNAAHWLKAVAAAAAFAFGWCSFPRSWLCAFFPQQSPRAPRERASADIYFLMRRKWSLFKQIATLLGKEITHFSRRHVTRARERDNFWMYAWFEFHVTTINQLLKSFSMVMIF